MPEPVNCHSLWITQSFPLTIWCTSLPSRSLSRSLSWTSSFPADPLLPTRWYPSPSKLTRTRGAPARDLLWRPWCVLSERTSPSLGTGGTVQATGAGTSPHTGGGCGITRSGSRFGLKAGTILMRTGSPGMKRRWTLSSPEGPWLILTHCFRLRC